MTFAEKKQVLKEYRAAEIAILELGERCYRWQNLERNLGDTSAQKDIEGVVKQLKEQILRLSKLRQMVEGAVNSLEDYTLRQVMHLRYILGADWDMVAESLGYSRRQVFNLHNKALENMHFTDDCTNCTF